jgi:hypothetical protein
MNIPRLSKAEMQAHLDSSLERLGVECAWVMKMARNRLALAFTRWSSLSPNG